MRRREGGKVNQQQRQIQFYSACACYTIPPGIWKAMFQSSEDGTSASPASEACPDTVYTNSR